MPRHKYMAVGVGENLVADHNPGMIRTDETGNRVDQRGLAGARAAEQRRKPAITRKICVKSKIGETVPDHHLEHSKPNNAPRGLACQQLRDEKRGHRYRDRDQGQAERAQIATRCLGEGVDRRGKRLRLARDV